MIGHEWLLRVLLSKQTAGDLGMAVKFNSEIPWLFAQLHVWGSPKSKTMFISKIDLLLDFLLPD